MPLDLTPTRSISDRAHSQRLFTRVLSVLAGVVLAVAFAAARHWLPVDLAGPALVILPLVILGTMWSGYRGRQLALADREKESGRAMIVAIAAQLGRQDDATLEQIRAKGGPAGEAAGLILTQRRTRGPRTGG